jgi:ribosome-associated protein
LPTKKTPSKSTRKAASARPQVAKSPSVRKLASAAARPARKRAAKAPAAEPALWMLAVHAAESKKAEDIKVLDLTSVTTFADNLILCTGRNQRQNQAIADEIEKQLKDKGERPQNIEGYSNAEWILMDYGDYIINIFSETARKYYDLERLWRDAAEVDWSGRLAEASV